MYNVSIPEISKEELLARYEHIKPIVEVDGKKYFLREYTEDELINRSYIWKLDKDKGEPVDMDKYVPIPEHDFDCIHEYGYPGFFKPSIAEVLAQLTDTDSVICSAFEIIESPDIVADFYKNRIVFENGYHMSKVRLYYKRPEH